MSGQKSGAAAGSSAGLPLVSDLLAAAVERLGGTTREGQQEMAGAVAAALDSGEHLLVQAGTGTGKSLAYLVPAVRHAVESGHPVVVSTATLALQAQVVDRDLPRVADALEPLLGQRPTYSLVKGRRNYLCKHKLVGGFPRRRRRCSTRRARARGARPVGSAPRSSGFASGPRRAAPATGTSWCRA